jgi:hypothetical protein
MKNIKNIMDNISRWREWLITEDGKKYSVDLKQKEEDLWLASLERDRGLLQNSRSPESFLEEHSFIINKQAQYTTDTSSEIVFPFLKGKDVVYSVLTKLTPSSSNTTFLFYSSFGLPNLVGQNIEARIIPIEPILLSYLGKSKSHVGGNLTRQSGQTIFDGMTVPVVYQSRSPLGEEPILDIRVGDFYAIAFNRNSPSFCNPESYQREAFISRGNSRCKSLDSLKNDLKDQVRKEILPETYGFREK